MQLTKKSNFSTYFETTAPPLPQKEQLNKDMIYNTLWTPIHCDV